METLKSERPARCSRPTCSVSSALRHLQRAKDTATKAIMDAIAAEATRRGMTDVKLLVWTNEYLRGDQVLTSAKIEKLLSRYNDEIHSGGLMGIWTAKHGWS